MKKFTKVCLITALILFVMGSIFCGIFGMLLGGFRQINSSNSNSLHLGGLGYNGNRWGFWYDEGNEDWEETGMNDFISTSAVQTDYKAADIKSIDIELNNENLTIAQSDTDRINIWIDSNSGNHIKYKMDGGTFQLYSTKRNRLWGIIGAPRGGVCLYLPKGMSLSSIDLEVGAGKLESIALEADEINFEAGAGQFNIEGIKGREVNIDVGAGTANINELNADEADVSAGAGSVSVKSIDVRELSLEVGMGNIDMEGIISRNADIECGMGNINANLDGAETDYNYKLECAIGNVRIGESRYSGLASERVIDNGSDRQFDVECSMGNITINFK